MKTLNNIPALIFVFVLLMFAFIATTKAQGITASTYIEQTKVSPKLGYMIGYHFGSEYGIEVGGFIQNEMQSPGQTTDTEYYMQRRETSFAGMYFNYPAYMGNKFEVTIQIRTGVVNAENFVITPSVEGSYKLTQKLLVSAGVGTRCFTPTLMSRVAWRF